MDTQWIEKPVEESARSGLREALGTSDFLAGLLVRRGITDPGEGKEFLKAPLSSLPPPHDMKDMMRAVELLWDHVVRGSKIAVYGDYDVDGISATAILAHFLAGLGAGIETFIASRFDYGYGLGPRQAEKIAGSGARCAVLVDCGTSDLEGTALLESKGITTVIVDHHRVGPELPTASAFINPMRPDCPFPYKFMTSAGLSFYVAAMMTSHARKKTALQGRLAEDVDPRDYLDLAAIGTVADVAPVTGANRCILKSGFKRMMRSGRPALVRMLAAAGVTKRVRGEEIVSFHFSPMLNAAGRMGDPMLALKFLLASGEEEAGALHEEIGRLNTMRRAEEKKVTGEALFELTKKEPERRASFVLHGRGWHPGVVGIVASRLVERTRCPVAVVSMDADVGRGSIRAPAGMNIYTPLDRHRDIFERFGGHSAAIGFTIQAGRIGDLEKKLEEASRDGMKEKHKVFIDARMRVEEVEWFHIEEIEKLSPFGMENPAPLICLEDFSIRGVRIVGSNHLKFFVEGKGGSIPVFGPNMGGRLGEVADGISLAGHLRPDTYRGGRSIEFLLKEIKRRVPE